jgi:predicted molibdopterin-dependent oxidoreductase YjgC
VNRLFPGPGQTRPLWSALDDLAHRMGGELGASSAAAIAKEIEKVAFAYHGITWDLLDWGDGRDGVVLPAPAGEQRLEYVPVDTDLRSVPAELGLHLGRILYDDGVRNRMSPALAALRPAARAYLNPDDAARLGLEPGSMVTVAGESGMAELRVAHDSSLALGALYVPANLPETAALGGAVAVTVTRGATS